MADAGRPAVPGEEPASARAPARGERIGVYVCHCGGNISDVVDVDKVADVLGREDGVAVARHITFMCSDEGQQSITDDIETARASTVSSWPPAPHRCTRRPSARRSCAAGMNPYLFLPANIREQVSWAHPHDAAAATDKAVSLVRAAVAKSRLLAAARARAHRCRPSHPGHRRRRGRPARRARYGGPAGRP